MTQKVLVFAFDLHEAAQVRTIRSLAATGVNLATVSFRRRNMAADSGHNWPDLPLGHVPNGLGLGRFWALLRAMATIARHRKALDADLLVARNLDMACLSIWARWLSGASAPLVYQVLDIHGVLTAPTPAGPLARRLERWVLAQSARLVTSSPGFLSGYFEPVQSPLPPVALLENKIWWTGSKPDRPVTGQPRSPDAPLRLGWIGTLRCPVSFALLRDVAIRLGPRVEIVLRGVVHHHQLPDFHTALKEHPNIRYEGPYSYPTGLAEAYAGLDCVWAQDLWQSAANSDWLLLNRLYEAGYFGCPLIAVAGTETARRVQKDGAGIVIPEATTSALAQALLAPPTTWQHYRKALLARPDTDFSLTVDDISRAFGLDSVQNQPSRTLQRRSRAA